jgi:hypothetical protein
MEHFFPGKSALVNLRQVALCSKQLYPKAKYLD